MARAWEGVSSSQEKNLPGEPHQAGAEQYLQGTPPGLEVGFVSGLVFLEGPLELVNAALTEARCYERAGRAVISLPLLS